MKNEKEKMKKKEHKKEHHKKKEHEKEHKKEHKKKHVDGEARHAKTGKVEKVMHEWKSGKLHSGSKKGPVVNNRKQAIAIALSEARHAGEKVKPKKKHK